MSRYKSPPGFHRHQCPVCGVVWEHRSLFADKALCQGPAASHGCPTPGCQGMNVRSYHGRKRPAYTTQEVTTA